MGELMGAVAGGKELEAAVQAQLFKRRVRVAIEATAVASELSSVEQRVLIERACSGASGAEEGAEASAKASVDAWLRQRGARRRARGRGGEGRQLGVDARGEEVVARMADRVVSAVLLRGTSVTRAVEEETSMRQRRRAGGSRGGGEGRGEGTGEGGGRGARRCAREDGGGRGAERS